LLGTNYRPTDNRPVPYWCISSRHSREHSQPQNYRCRPTTHSNWHVN